MVLDVEMLVVAQVDQAVIARPSIGMEYGSEAGATTNGCLQSGFRGVGHDGAV